MNYDTTLFPPDFYDPVIEFYNKDVDRTLIRENLKLTPDERSQKFVRATRLVFEMQRAGREQRERTGKQP